MEKGKHLIETFQIPVRTDIYRNYPLVYAAFVT